MQSTAQQWCFSSGRQGLAELPDQPVDFRHLRRFTLGNRELEAEVLQLFAEQAPRMLRAMQLATSGKAWRDATHTLKGSAGAIGAVEVARAAAQAELVLDDAASWPAAIVQVQSAVEDACTFIAASTKQAG